jgi:hypothetical protein
LILCGVDRGSIDAEAVFARTSPGARDDRSVW